MTEISNFISKIKFRNYLLNLDEASTKQAIILPILHLLGWATFDIEEVTPEYGTSGRRVDYALRLSGQNQVFLEIKKPSESLEKHEKQLLEYSFYSGVRLACLSNGITWHFYLPLMPGDWTERKFYTIDILEQDSMDVEENFDKFLSRERIKNGEAFRFAEEIYKSTYRQKIIQARLPEAWNRIISDPPDILIDLLADVTEKICGFRPNNKEAFDFLFSNKSKFILSTTSPSKPDMPSLRRPLQTQSFPKVEEDLDTVETAVHLRVPFNLAEKELNSLSNHKTFSEGLSRYWKSDQSGRVKGQGVCWLFCWAATGMGVPTIAQKAKEIFNKILDVSFDEFNKQVGLDQARQLRYENKNIEQILKENKRDF